MEADNMPFGFQSHMMTSVRNSVLKDAYFKKNKNTKLSKLRKKMPKLE
jgi:hypothetical protein